MATAQAELDELLVNNRDWSARMQAADAGFFKRMSKLQAPQRLWIGCSDSRVPANEIVGLRPGEIFVHRNVANLVVPTDLNCLAVIEYAVTILKIKHLMVVGHYGCGGVNTALTGRRECLVGHWLHHLELVRHLHARRLDAISGREALANRLCELNVLEQVGQLSRLPTVLDAWRQKQPLTLHGLIYGIHDGLLRNLGSSISNAPDLQVWRKAALKALWAQPTVSSKPT